MTSYAMGYIRAPGKGHGVELLLPATMPEKIFCNSCLKDWSKGVIYEKQFLCSLPWLSAIEVEVAE